VTVAEGPAAAGTAQRNVTVAIWAGASRAPALTSLASGAGCGCKLPAADLLAIVGALPKQVAPQLLVGAATADDAAVFQVREDLALVQTVDFFTPVVDEHDDPGGVGGRRARRGRRVEAASRRSAVHKRYTERLRAHF
jgi:hypothetical protein